MKGIMGMFATTRGSDPCTVPPLDPRVYPGEFKTDLEYAEDTLIAAQGRLDVARRMAKHERRFLPVEEYASLLNDVRIAKIARDRAKRTYKGNYAAVFRAVARERLPAATFDALEEEARRRHAE